MTGQKSCRKGLIQNLSEKDVGGLKEMYMHLFDLKTRVEEPPLQKTDTAKSGSSWFGGKSKAAPPPAEAETLTYDQFEEELMRDIMVDHPDNLLIRYLKARKYDSKAAFIMIRDSVKFLHNQGFRDVIRTGERELLQHPLELGLFYFYSHDLEGNAILYLSPRVHKPKESPDEKFAKIIMYIMAQGYLLLGDKKITVVVDLKGLSLSNIEYANVKFTIDILANNCPEVLSRVLMFNSPWIFSSIWSIVAKFLDPAVKDKIQFCSQEELQKFIAADQLPISLGGANTHEYKYQLPSAAEVATKPQDAEYERLIAERKELAYTFLSKSQEWVDGKSVEAERDALAQKLSENFRELSPYIWSPSYYQRNGFIQNFDEAHF
ncbi:CRAL/TRIO domain-containing protein [Conidiobolus coronatus NRRL 28638]|uniref:CRAL/TRIO domain-containing protein n=1 Tax=Conidiobolus coronatus (strain ATCC 28846 / CBS 209.66 / NRRL 28638) TaxID=796925 RepID=A0A137NT78_CONC2|nr:CRAL/TRIO domain-containing protein [Conidiobolus coronatus NRRL 28638]|eukprot:KXN65973.1 CRAL/TRIO domain-containing protein [Conidiobolus coronatus NRRL 28638]